MITLTNRQRNRITISPDDIEIIEDDMLTAECWSSRDVCTHSILHMKSGRSVRVVENPDRIKVLIDIWQKGRKGEPA